MDALPRNPSGKVLKRELRQIEQPGGRVTSAAQLPATAVTGAADGQPA